MADRLIEVDWQGVIARGEPWVDEDFKYGPYCLWINHKGPVRPTASTDFWQNNLIWKRASEHFEGDFKIFDGIDPSDIIMGGCNNCYALAALSGMAEAHKDEENEEDKGARIRDNFLT